MIEKIVNGITWGLLGIDGLIVLVFVILVLSLIGNKQLDEHGQILEQISHQNDPEYWREKSKMDGTILGWLWKTLLFGGLFIMLSFGIIFLMFYLTGRW